MYGQHDDKWQILRSDETVVPQLQATDALKNYSFGPEKPNSSLGSLLFVALVMTEWV
jgi:hypothetical protein